MIERKRNLGEGIRYEDVVNIRNQSWCGTWRGGCETGVYRERDNKTVCVDNREINIWMKQTSVEIIK